MFEVSKKFDFEAAHSLPHLPEGHKCRSIHGHSYVFEVICKGDLDGRGFVIDYAEISEAAKPLVDKMDHKDLNALFPFSTTAENLARYIFDELSKKINVHQVRFYETATTTVTYPSR